MAKPTYITRYDYKRTHGWWVRLERQEYACRKLFSDAQYGGKEKAYQAALKFRDQNLHKMPPARRGGTVSRKRPYGYVNRITRRYSARGKRYVYEAWQAWAITKLEVVRSTTFSIDRHGERAAKRLANAALKGFLA